MDVSERMWGRLAGAGAERRFRRGEVLLHQGDEPTHVALLLSGRVKVVLYPGEGSALLLAVRGPGEALGVMGVAGATDRSATVVALEVCVTRTLPAERFLALVREAGEEAVLLRNAMLRIREGEAWRAETASLPARLRVVRALLRLAVPVPGAPLEVPLGQAEIGQAVGLSRGVVAAELARLREARLVTTDTGRVVIDDQEGLRALAGTGQIGV
ncbi:Crp/Fnr family transcriptional regulator [Actinocorallia longicatena]|uniref:Crp/Fnr family transcriptional regulator n=1 Tax=Actinocorallia longicatena TaxID=111803 RepID=UPI0031D0C517